MTVLLAFFSAVFLFSGGMLLNDRLTAGREQDAFQKLAQQAESDRQQAQTEDGTPDAYYTELARQNGDLCGWVSIEGTAVDYPVMQTPEEPEHYLRRNFSGGTSVAGTPFLDARCDMENGALLIVYGHNMNDGSMFGALQGYLDEEYSVQHPEVRCDSLTQLREYTVMAVLRFQVTEQALADYYTIPQDEAGFSQYVQRLEENALYTTGVKAAWGDQLLILSTCERADNTSRILVAARKAG